MFSIFVFHVYGALEVPLVLFFSLSIFFRLQLRLPARLRLALLLRLPLRLLLRLPVKLLRAAT